MHSVTYKNLHRKLLILGILPLFGALLASVTFGHTIESDPSTFVFTPEVIEAVAERKANESDLEMAKRVERSYKATGISLMTDRSWLKLDDVNARGIFEVTNVASFYTDSPQITGDQVKALAALERLHAARPNDVTQTYRALLAARSFDVANHFFTQHSADLAHPPPKIVEPSAMPAGSPSELRIVEGGSILMHKAAGDVDRGIIVVADPLCAYTQRAVLSIHQDPVLSELMRSHAKWIAPPSRQDDFFVYARWNIAHPQQQMSLAFRKSDWPMVKQWATPIFYFTRGGHVVETIAGWPLQGHNAELLTAAKRIGIEVPENNAKEEVHEKR